MHRHRSVAPVADVRFPQYVAGSAGWMAIDLSSAQKKVLIEALQHTMHEARRKGAPGYPLYHRGYYGFGITRGTAAVLARQKLVTSVIEDHCGVLTQRVALTGYGFQVAMAIAEIKQAPLPQLPPSYFTP